MIKVVVASEWDGLDETSLAIVFDVKDGVDIQQAVLNACKEYCLTEEGKSVFESNGCCFNWGDFQQHVPNEICEKYGIKKIDYTYSNSFDFNQQLVDEEEIFPEVSGLDAQLEAVSKKVKNGMKDTHYNLKDMKICR